MNNEYSDFEPNNETAAANPFELSINDNERVHRLFEASVKGVQSSFNHLSHDDIAYPPHRWFDAALARQIAIHIMVTRFDIPKRRLALELQRSRESVSRALSTVTDRLQNDVFSESYDQMAEIAGDELNNIREGNQ